MKTSTKGYIFAIISSLISTPTFITNFLVLQKTSVSTLTFYFFGFAVIGSFAILAVTGKLGQARRAFKKYAIPVIVIGSIGGVISIFWFNALKLVGSAPMGFFMRFASVFSIAMGVVYLKEKFSKGEMLAASIMILGALILTFKASHNLVQGGMLAITLAFVIALEQFFLKKYVEKVDPYIFNALRLVFNFLIVAAYGMAIGEVHMPSSEWMYTIIIGSAIGAVVGFSLFLKSLELAELSKVTMIRSMDPFMIMIYSALFLHTLPVGMQLLGGITIGIGAFVLILSKQNPRLLESYIHRIKVWTGNAYEFKRRS